MAQAGGKGGCGSAIGCVIVLAGLGFAGWKFYPEIHAFIAGRSAPVEWGHAHDGDALRVRVLAAAVETTGIEDALGSREGGQDLHVTLEITNLGDTAATYRTPRLLGASEPRLLDDQGREVKPATYGDDARIEGRLAHGQEIAPHDHETHDLLFKQPSAGSKYFLLNVDLRMFGRSGVVQFRIPAEQVKGLR
jgi:hypothetical protein